LEEINIFNYLTHIVFRLFENLNLEPEDPKRFRLELCISQGSKYSEKNENDSHKQNLLPLISINTNLDLNHLEHLFDFIK
jgi:hypothetical protein